MAALAQKVAAEPEGDTAELIAWSLTEWIRLVEQIADRPGLLGAFNESMLTTDGAGADASGTHRRLAYRLTRLVAEMEGRDLGHRNQGDRAWILATYAECLEAVMGRRKTPVAAAVPA